MSPRHPDAYADPTSNPVEYWRGYSNLFEAKYHEELRRRHDAKTLQIATAIFSGVAAVAAVVGWIRAWRCETRPRSAPSPASKSAT